MKTKHSGHNLKGREFNEPQSNQHIVPCKYLKQKSTPQMGNTCHSFKGRGGAGHHKQIVKASGTMFVSLSMLESGIKK